MYYSKNSGVGGWAWTGFEDSVLDGILSKMKNSVDPVKACDYAKKAQVIIQENAIQLPTMGQAMIYVHKSELKDFSWVHKEANFMFTICILIRCSEEKFTMN